MRPFLSHYWNRAALASLVLSACTGEIDDHPAACSSAELRSAYDAAYAWGEEGGASQDCDDESCRTPELDGVRAVTSDASAACVLAGSRAGLRRGCRGGRGGNHGGGGGHGGGGNDGELQQCKDDGRFTGEAAAVVFCDLSIALGGLGVDELLTPGPESQCSKKFESACTKAFDRVVNANAACRPFATGEFQEAFEVQRFNQCLFSVGEPEPEPVDPCANGACECRDAASCELACEGEGCDLTCERTSQCDASCGDDCNIACHDMSRCEATAGSAADLRCERASSCELSAESGKLACSNVSSCEIDVQEQAEVSCESATSCDIDCPTCNVQCRNVGLCKVELERGRVRCDQVGRCQVECDGAGQRRPKRCNDGSYVCGQACR